MTTLDKGQDKIDQICTILRKDTLEPAEKKAAEIINAAEKKAQDIILEAEKKHNTLLSKAKDEIEQEKKVFQSSLYQAARQGVEYLRQEIEEKLFNPELTQKIKTVTVDPQIIASIISALVHSIEKEGMSGDLSAYIPQTVSAQAVNALLLDGVLHKLKNGSVEVGTFDGGAQVKIKDKRITIDMSDKALKDLLANYIRKDLRKYIFG